MWIRNGAESKGLQKRKSLILTRTTFIENTFERKRILLIRAKQRKRTVVNSSSRSWKHSALNQFSNLTRKVEKGGLSLAVHTSELFVNAGPLKNCNSSLV